MVRVFLHIVLLGRKVVALKREFVRKLPRVANGLAWRGKSANKEVFSSSFLQHINGSWALNPTVCLICQLLHVSLSMYRSFR